MEVPYKIIGALIIALTTSGSYSTELNNLYFDFSLTNSFFFFFEANNNVIYFEGS